MAPTTRSSAKPKTEAVAAKQSPKAIKKKPQPKKQAGKKPAKTEKDNSEIEKHGENQERTDQENTSDIEMSDTVNTKKANIKKNPPKKQTGKKPAKTDEIENEENGDENTTTAETIHEFSVKDIDGNEVSLEKYKGNVCIIVNVASRCGHTKSNYDQFVELYDKYAESNGLRILAFPCNQFGSQESGTCEKIKAFAENKGVKFDMFDKINVNGKNASPLWQFLKEKLPEVTSGKSTGKDIKWNFTKFIIDKEGVPVERYASSTKPLDLVDSLEKLW